MRKAAEQARFIAASYRRNSATTLMWERENLKRGIGERHGE
jgi:hypothetical protein